METGKVPARQGGKPMTTKINSKPSSQWRACIYCGHERRIVMGRTTGRARPGQPLVDHRRYDSALGEMVPCEGGGTKLRQERARTRSANDAKVAA
jgi:hypothetical protein